MAKKKNLSEEWLEKEGEPHIFFISEEIGASHTPERYLPAISWHKEFPSNEDKPASFLSVFMLLKDSSRASDLIRNFLALKESQLHSDARPQEWRWLPPKAPMYKNESFGTASNELSSAHIFKLKRLHITLPKHVENIDSVTRYGTLNLMA